MALSGSMGQELTIVAPQATLIRLFFTTLEFLVMPLFIVHTSFCSSFPPFSPLTHLSGTQGLCVSGVVSGVVSGGLCPACAVWHWTGVVTSVLCLPRPAWLLEASSQAFSLLGLLSSRMSVRKLFLIE